MRISDWSSDVCSSDLRRLGGASAERTGLGSPILTEEDCEKANRQLFHHFALASDLQEGPSVAEYLGLSQEVPEDGKPSTNQAKEVKRSHEEAAKRGGFGKEDGRSEEHTSELQSLMRISYAVFCLKKKKRDKEHETKSNHKYTIDGP